MYYFGWTTLMIIPLPVLVGITIALLAIRREADRLHRSQKL